MATDKDKNVSCFTLDGVVAEMVIEVEDNQKAGFDDYKDLASSPSKDVSKSNDDVESENKVEVVGIAPGEVFSEKREDKENIEDVSEASIYMKDKQESDNSIQSLKKERKRKLELNLTHGENEKVLDLPRYPGRKRQANKRYISDDMITSITDTSENVQAKETFNVGEKRKKFDTDFRDLNREKVISSKKSDQTSIEKSSPSDAEKSCKEDSVQVMKDQPDSVEEECIQILNDALNTEEPKQKILRKLPFRKNRNDPDVPDLKPKVFLWNGVGEGLGVKLGDLSGVRKRIKTAKSVRALYRVLFFQWPTNGQDLVAQILNFNGFPFDKTSYEFTKRQSLMKIMFDATVINICDLLGLQTGPKASMINNILNFLLKPTGKIDPALDPSLQPIVLLERLELDHRFFQSSPESVKPKRGVGRPKSNMPAVKVRKKSFESTPITPVRTTRNSVSRLKMAETPLNKKSSVKASEDQKPSSVKTRPSSTKETAKETPKEKIILPAKNSRLSSKEDKPKIEDKAESFDKSQKFSSENEVADKVKKVNKSKKKTKKSKSSSKHKGITKKTADNSPKNKVVTDMEMEVDDEPPVVEDDMKRDDGSQKPALTEENAKDKPEEAKLVTEESAVLLSDSSETESAEETKLVTASQPTPKSSSKPSQRRKGKPLRMFPKISDSIQKANFSALQRLHILLFGASDKAENLKGNILAFGGFPFLEGSDEWKQKHFLLSLLAQNNLREYLKLLCIEYSDDDQPTMISKLMQFLAAPTENLVESRSPEIEAKPASPELKNKEPETLSKRSKLEPKKKTVKKSEKKPGRRRKVLMSEEEARRLEASFAREQRALARDSRTVPLIARQPSVTEPYVPPEPQAAPPKQPITDPHQLNALLQTVYKRRALKAAGAVVSTPNKGEKIKLGDIENIKFLIVTSNLTDLEVLHQLIYMMPASKSRLRKNILDFDGFGFNEDSKKYKERMDLLNSLGYDVSKRLSFLLGLCPLHTDIPRQDLNELIMYFLMSPCRSKQVVPITQMPADPTIGLSDESHVILKSTLEMEKKSLKQAKLLTAPETFPLSKVPEASIKSSTPAPGIRQKARKSFSSSLKLSPVKKVLLPPATSSAAGRMLNINPKQSVGSIPKSVAVLNSVQTLPTYSIPKTSALNTGTGISLLSSPGNVAVLNAPKSQTITDNVNTLIKVPVINPVSKMQLMSSTSKVSVLDAATKIPHIAGQIIQNPVVMPNVSSKVGLLPKSNVPAPMLPGSKMLVRTPSGMSSPQEFIVQQQTPDGQQKTFKLIRLPPNHPLASAVKPPVQQAMPQVQQPVIIAGAPITGSTLPPGIVVMKNSHTFQLPGQNVQNLLQTLPLKVNLPINKPSSSVMTTSLSNTDEFVLPDQGESAGSSEKDPDVEILNPLEDNPPTDSELYSSIQEIILSSNFEDITLRNVIERVSAQFPHHDLTHRHNFMKDCVKKIIIGT